MHQDSLSSNGSSNGEELQPLKRKGGPGRKQTDEEPATKRIAQVRVNARAYRERKQKYLQELEATVESLKAGTAEANALRDRVAQLEAENQQLRQAQFGLFDLTSAPLVAAPLLGMGEMSPINVDPLLQLTPDLLPGMQFDTFTGMHPDWDLEQLLGGNDDLRALLNTCNTPLPVAPSCEQVIQPLFSGVMTKMKAIPSLKDKPELVDELVRWYIRNLEFKTREKNPLQCRISIGRIKKAQTKILDVCSRDTLDTFLAEKMFQNVKKEYDINFEVNYPDPFEFVKHLTLLPSLSGEKATIDELCGLYECFTINKEERPVTDAKIHAIHSALLAKCTTSSDIDTVKFTFDCLDDIFSL
ncbi:hypothetical protein BCR33DRAFT_786894 [Rhizoclosmatium globosum]|uniref:BZIP domain-containing protein n=1 Tax=Rhizoclosmatium globosum TaxID=329046 RepID=A0A1Y2C3N9_9FUNG|nr:hypothetical protein BCR33DRAFT_786894 [Rhizoclosmatium globosum]|eukprot:ORY41663.1 hypothetical protein BCR33DRAFT_786894 [Rhizoclosmatium globosum]